MHRYVRGRGTVAAAVLAAAMLALCCSCALLPVEDEVPPPPLIRSYETETYEFASVQRGDITESVRISCSYTPARKEELAFEEGGVIISAIYVSEGDHVEQGQVVAELERGEILEQIESCEYDISVQKLLRTQLDEDAGYTARSYDLQISAAEDSGDAEAAERLREQKQSAAETAQSQRNIYSTKITSLQNKLDELRGISEKRQLVAPFAGTVTAVKSSSVETLSVAGDDVVTIADKSTSVFVVSGEDASYFEIGDKVSITISSTTYAATVVDGADYGGESSDTKSYIELDEYVPDIRDNATGSVTLVTDERTDVLWVPSGAVKSADGKDFVYVLDESNIRVVKYIETGFKAGGRVEVISGLELGEQVIVA